jgi:hypothetical protein
MAVGRPCLRYKWYSSTEKLLWAESFLDYLALHIQVADTLPSVVTGRRWGSIPNEYWNRPLPRRATGAIPVTLRQYSWADRNQEPSGLGIWSYTSVSPNEITGTNGVLRDKQQLFKFLSYLEVNSTSLSSSSEEKKSLQIEWIRIVIKDMTPVGKPEWRTIWRPRQGEKIM